MSLGQLSRRDEEEKLEVLAVRGIDCVAASNSACAEEVFSLTGKGYPRLSDPLIIAWPETFGFQERRTFPLQGLFRRLGPSP